MAEKPRGYIPAQQGSITPQKKPNEWISFAPVPVIGAVFIPDALKALLEQERSGQLEIIRHYQLSERALGWVRQEEKNTILKHGLLDKDNDFARFMKEKYPASWADALELSRGL